MFIVNKKYINNKKYLYLVCLLLAIIMLESCKKNNYSVDKDPPKEAPEFSQFAPADNRLNRIYAIQTNNNPFKIPVGFSNISNQDREIKFNYVTGTAISGTHYSAPLSIIIPAGKALDSLVFKGFSNAYPLGRKDTIKIKILEPKPMFGRDSFVLVLQKYCDVVLSQLSGQFDNTREYTSSGAEPCFPDTCLPYTTYVENLVATSPTTAKGVFVNLYDFGWNDIEFIMDWTDPNDFYIFIPRQPTGRTGSSSRIIQYVKSSPGRTNIFSSCSSTYTISLDLLGVTRDRTTGDIVDTLLSRGFQFRIQK